MCQCQPIHPVARCGRGEGGSKRSAFRFQPAFLSKYLMVLSRLEDLLIATARAPGSGPSSEGGKRILRYGKKLRCFFFFVYYGDLSSFSVYFRLDGAVWRRRALANNRHLSPTAAGIWDYFSWSWYETAGAGENLRLNLLIVWLNKWRERGLAFHLRNGSRGVNLKWNVFFMKIRKGRPDLSM